MLNCHTCDAMVKTQIYVYDSLNYLHSTQQDTLQEIELSQLGINFLCNYKSEVEKNGKALTQASITN